MSLLVVIKGPVAIAGSIPLLSKNNGTNVPMKPATTITAISDMEIANEVGKSPFQIQVKISSKQDRINPFNNANNISFINLLLMLPLMSSLARPCTIIALDCTPTLPAIAAINGVNRKVRYTHETFLQNRP